MIGRWIISIFKFNIQQKKVDFFFSSTNAEYISTYFSDLVFLIIKFNTFQCKFWNKLRTSCLNFKYLSLLFFNVQTLLNSFRFSKFYSNNCYQLENLFQIIIHLLKLESFLFILRNYIFKYVFQKTRNINN
jgi:hypothetical protein